MSGTTAVLSKKGKNAAETALAMLKTLEPKKAEAYGIASSTIIKMKRSLEAFQDQDVNSPTVIGFVTSRIPEQDEAQLLKLTDATLIFDGRIYGVGAENADAATAAQKLQRHHEQDAEMFVKRTEGDFVFVIAESERIIAGRDVMGVRPLYYGENTNFAALASERKALWRIGMEKTSSFPPGYIALIDKHGFRFTPVRKLDFSKPKHLTMQTAAIKLQTLLEQSTKERVYGLKEVAVAFSGGLDSSIIALLAEKSGTNVHLVHVSLKDQPETEHARRAAEELELPIHSCTYNEEDIEKILPNVLQLIEEPDPVKVSIGIPVYWAAEKTAEMNLRVMLAGQGADEIFGGYRRYVDCYLQYGSKKVEAIIFNDIVRMYETNFERDSKICNFHNVELRLPFASYRIAKFAIDLPVELKIEPSNNTLRKLVLRQAAKRLGLPQSIVNRPKKAFQYATGVNKALKEIAGKKGLSVREYVQETFQTTFKETTLHE
jgi:asparagine synthetase B (glutamine-hydrolysing)